MSHNYNVAHIETHNVRAMPEFGLREPFGWRVAGLEASSELRLSWAAEIVEGTARLRIAVLDTREPQYRVEVRLNGSGRVVGEFDIRWAAHFQLFEIELSPSDAAEIAREGAVLRVVEGEKPLWILTGARGATPLPDALAPHLLAATATEGRAEFLDRVASLAVVQCFGWMEGCIMDGLHDLAQISSSARFKAALRAHLELFFRPDGQLIYEIFGRWPDGSRAFGAPSDNRIGTIETTLPFAALCHEFPDHRALQLALDFWDARTDETGLVRDGNVTTEGSYTVGSAMAVIARARGDRELARRALAQVTLRHQILFDGQRLPRWRGGEAGAYKYGDINWSRGVAWQLLGAARTLAQLEGFIETGAARAQFVELARWTRSFQRPDGLWSVFLHEPELAPDTAGCAGIAAALAIGARRGWLEREDLEAAQRAHDALENYLTPDGFLRGVSQSNKGGEALQRSSYRPIYQMGMGLMAQLVAALHTTEIQ